MINIWRYLRQSEKDEEKQINSIPAQGTITESYCQTRKYKITQTIEERHSAWDTSKKRPLFSKMIKEAIALCQEGQQVTIVSHKVNRLVRNLKEFSGAIKDAVNAGVKFEFVEGKFSENAMGKFSFGLFVLVAEWYSDNLSEEVIKAHNEFIHQERYPGSMKLGYIRTIKDGKRNFKPDPVNGPILKECLIRVNNGQTPTEVFRWVRNISKLRTTSGSIIQKAHFFKKLKDPFPCGLFDWNGKRYKGTHIPLISEKIFFENQNILEGRRNIETKTHEYLFQGLTFCNKCSTPEKKQKLRVETIKGKYKYYRCRHCKGSNIEEQKLEKKFLSFLKSLTPQESTQKIFISASRQFMDHMIDEEVERTDNIVKKIAIIKKKMIKVREMMYNNVISQEEFLEDKNRLLAEERELKEKHDTNKNAPDANTMDEVLKRIGELLNIARLSYKSLDYSEKAFFIRKTVANFFIGHRNKVIEPVEEISYLFRIIRFQSGAPMRTVGELIYEFHHIVSLRDMLEKILI